MGLISVPDRRIRKPIGMPQIDRRDPINRGLVGYWGMFPYEFGGKVVHDLSGNGNTGTFGAGAASPIWVAGKSGAALLYGGNDYATLTLSSSGLEAITNGPPLTIIISVKPSASGTESIFGKAAGIASAYMAISLYTESSKFSFRTRNAAGNTITSISPTVYDSTQHYIVAATYDGAIQRLYVDGIQVDSDAQTGDFRNLTSDRYPTLLGALCKDSVYSNFLNGIIDWGSAYNRDLSSSEIAQLSGDPLCNIIYPRKRAMWVIKPVGGVVYQELNLTVIADASAAEIDTHAMVDTGKAVQAVASAIESDTQQMVETGKEVSADASVSCTDLKVVFELNLTVTATGSVVATEAHTMMETGKSVTAVASTAVLDTQAMVEIDLGVSADASVSCTDMMGLLAHIAAFMILRQCTT